MPLMQWSAQYSVGIKRMDDQHQYWIELINALHDAMKDGKGPQVVARVYKEMMDYTRTHFAAEEKLMKDTGYPAYADHKALHDAFVRNIEQKMGGDTNGIKGTLEAMTTLKDWLLNHIQKTDKSYTAHFQSKGVN